MTTLPAAEPAGLDTDTFLKGLWRENPVFVQVLGMCPVLAVSNTAMNGLAMGLAATFVLVMSSTLVSLLRNVIPKQVRIATFILIIATFVTIVDFLIQAISLDVHKALGAFIALIVVNCIILGRAEAFASKNSLVRSVLDAAGMGLGFTFALLCLGVVREVLGSGTLFDIPLFGDSFQTWSITLLPGGGFFTLGLWLLLFAGWSQRRQRRQARQEA
ncbi:MAG TPA: electron transport complex subunit E [Candidatus Latescibacteria bacterium]|jgi:electron transport complex protein RnfE|nr:electron transport complex subunit RsxE [Gemmatimonadaceae bacterium]MDP6014558.1 electron transport complex subunit E [Candidatus Latescibacterota bacterium]HJP30256.1 electron transport complex subunit E [Candidatus Latescibacterota bacterium]